MAERIRSNRISFFEFEGITQDVSFVETVSVKRGVDCDVYTFDGDKEKDLGIIKVQKGLWTPPQMVLSGDRTVEGYVSGAGRLVIIHENGTLNEYHVDGSTGRLSVDVKVWEIMKWQASDSFDLVASEICFPPYKEGRYKNLFDVKI